MERNIKINHSGVVSMKTRSWFVVMFAFLAATGCETLTDISDNAPAAQWPVLTSLLAAPSDTGAFTTVEAEGVIVDHAFPENNNPGVYRVLSSASSTGLPRGVIKIFFTTASPLLTLKVGVEGTALPKFADVPANLDPKVVGYYRVESVDASGNWQVTIHPPLSTTPRFALHIRLQTVSINPNYPPGHHSHETAYMLINLVAKPLRLGFMSPTSGSSCVLVPNLPPLRPGLRLIASDLNTTKINVGCCDPFPDSTVSTFGAAGTLAGVTFPFSGFRKYSLVMRVGSQREPGDTTFTTNQAGPLEVCINDDNLANNSGAWGIGIQISE